MKMTVKKIKIRRRDGSILPLLIMKNPAAAVKNPPLILWLHGGGYALGMAEMALFSRPADLVRKYGAIVISPEYRLSGEAPYPSALSDCYRALLWVKKYGARLGGNTSQIMVGGESAGGGLTAALTILARDRGKVNIAFQMPLYPMLDDRPTESSRDNHAPVWNTRRNLWAWEKYLRGIKNISAYAAPARLEDFTALPPMYTFVGDIEPFYRETLDYTEKLRAAGVTAHCDVYHGWWHGYDLFFPKSEMGKRAIAEFERQYLYAAEHYSAKNQ